MFRLLLLVGFALLAVAIAYFGRGVLRSMENSGRRGIRAMLPLILIMVVLILAASGASVYTIATTDMLERVDLRAQATQVIAATQTALAGGEAATATPEATSPPVTVTVTVPVIQGEPTAVPRVVVDDNPLPLVPPILTATQLVVQAELTVMAVQTEFAASPTPPPPVDSSALNDPYVLTAIALVEQITQQAAEATEEATD